VPSTLSLPSAVVGSRSEELVDQGRTGLVYHHPRPCHRRKMIRSTTENLLGARYADGLDWSIVMDLLTRGMQRVMMRTFEFCKLTCAFPAQLVDQEG
jgi:hypothetical protein